MTGICGGSVGAARPTPDAAILAVACLCFVGVMSLLALCWAAENVRQQGQREREKEDVSQGNRSTRIRRTIARGAGVNHCPFTGAIAGGHPQRHKETLRYCGLKPRAIRSRVRENGS
jgi:hypothetical protein